MRKIKVNPKSEQVKIAVIGKACTWESVPQSSGTWEEAARVELTSYNGMTVVCCNKQGTANLRHQH